MDTCVCMHVCIYMAEFLCCSPESITLLIGYASVPNEKFKIKKKFKK